MLKLLSGTLLIFSLFSCHTDERPNVILILADDLGAGDLHCTGHPYAKSPNLDKLASEGIRFKRAYMAGSWCAPSRFGLMSGQYPARFFDKTRTLRSEEPSVTSILKEAGYRTGHIGKWHLTNKNDSIRKPEKFGVDYHFISNGPNASRTWTSEQKEDPYLRAHSTDYFVDEAIEFIKTCDGSEPFYLNLWVYPTHSYIDPTPEQLAVYKGLKVDLNDFSDYQQAFLKFVAEHGDIDKAMQAYCADITAMDKALGRLFQYLEKQGLNKNTVIVFSSDNGPGPLAGQVLDGNVVNRYKKRPTLLNNVGSSGIYKERKLSLHEGGIRTPFIVRWPGMVPAGQVDSVSILHGTDWLPTVAAICNATLPEGIYDGIDVSQAYLGNTIKRAESVYWTLNQSTAMLDNQWKAMLNGKGEFFLFDIVKDPDEKNPVNDQFPEVAQQMKQSLLDWRAEISE